MILLTLLIANLIWIGYSLTEGMVEGFYWHYENKSKKVCDFNINPIFGLQRVLIVALTSIILTQTIGYFSLLNIASMILMFPFFHNGTYYYTRNKLDKSVYKSRWSDESKTIPSISPLFSYRNRTIGMVLGILTQIFVYLFLL